MTKEEEHRAEQNRRKLLAAEAAFLLLLFRRRDEVLRSAGGRSRWATADALSSSLTWAILSGRAMATDAGASRVFSELRDIGARVGQSTPVNQARDLFFARRSAGSYAARWFKAAQADPATAATKTDAALTRIGVTENASAYNSARTRAAETSTGLLAKVWDATLDKLTCPVCRGADGYIVGIRESFPFGEPGSVHPNCACTWSLVTITQATRSAA